MSYSEYAGESAREYKAWREEGGDAVELWPEGWYPAQVVEAKDGIVPKSGSGEMAKIVFKLKRESDRKNLTKYLCYVHGNRQVQTIARRQMGHLSEVFGTSDVEDWLGSKLDVKIRVPKEKVNSGGYTNDNELTGFDTLGERTDGVVKVEAPSPEEAVDLPPGYVEESVADEPEDGDCPF